jgi:hypothetical protein
LLISDFPFLSSVEKIVSSHQQDRRVTNAGFREQCQRRLFGHQEQYLLNAMHRKHDLSSLVWRTGQHFVRHPRFLEREHGAHLRGQLSAIEQSRECA